MTTETALLSAIREHPEDDLPRLAFADWLEETGDERSLARAEFIRVQIALARGDDVDLLRREAELLADQGAAWQREELPEGVQIDDPEEGSGFRRGFAADVCCQSPALIAGGESLARLPVERLRIERLEGGHAALAACPSLAHFRRLSLVCSGIDVAELAALLASPHLPELTEVALGPASLGVRGAGLLAGCERLRRLTNLDVGSCRFTDRGVRMLLGSPYLRCLEKVNLSGGSLTDEGAMLLAAHEPARQWKELEAGYNGFTRPGVEALLASPNLRGLESLGLCSIIFAQGHWLADPIVEAVASLGLPPRLRRLDLHSSHFSSAAFVSLAARPALAGLEALNLGVSEIDRRAAQALADSPHLAGLRTLDLYFAGLDAAGVEGLASSPHLRPRRLSLRGNSFGPDGMAALARSLVLEGIFWLDVAEADVGDAGMRALAGAAWVGRLRELDLSHNGVGDAGAEALAGSAGLGGLVRLCVSGNAIGDAGARALAESAHVSRLRHLDLSSNRIGNEGALALARSPRLHPLLRLNLSDNPVGPAAMPALRERFGGRLGEPAQVE
jgi:uncharacterized protein (TIGR02996 family)